MKNNIEDKNVKSQLTKKQNCFDTIMMEKGGMKNVEKTKKISLLAVGIPDLHVSEGEG